MSAPIPAEVTAVEPPRTDPVSGRPIAGYVTVRDETGTLHLFVTGSLNGVRDPAARRVGTRGTVRWVRATSFNLPFFRPEAPR